MSFSLDKCSGVLEKIRSDNPLIHAITNYVAVNISANALLSIGALPVMAADKNEIEDIVKNSQALVLNTGTLSPERFEALIYAGKSANKAGVPIVLDPVGAGGSKVRGERVLSLLNEIDIQVIRGNHSEIAFLIGQNIKMRGVEAGTVNLNPKFTVLETAKRYKSTVCVTGEKDYFSCGDEVYICQNGNPLFTRISGAGCMLSAIIGAFLAVEESSLLATISAVLCYTVAGEMAAENSRGPGSFQPALFDYLYLLKAQDIRDRGLLTTE